MISKIRSKDVMRAKRKGGFSFNRKIQLIMEAMLKLALSEEQRQEFVMILGEVESSKVHDFECTQVIAKSRLFCELFVPYDFDITPKILERIFERTRLQWSTFLFEHCCDQVSEGFGEVPLSDDSADLPEQSRPSKKTKEESRERSVMDFDANPFYAFDQVAHECIFTVEDHIELWLDGDGPADPPSSRPDTPRSFGASAPETPESRKYYEAIVSYTNTYNYIHTFNEFCQKRYAEEPVELEANTIDLDQARIRQAFGVVLEEKGFGGFEESMNSLANAAREYIEHKGNDVRKYIEHKGNDARRRLGAEVEEVGGEGRCIEKSDIGKTIEIRNGKAYYASGQDLPLSCVEGIDLTNLPNAFKLTIKHIVSGGSMVILHEKSSGHTLTINNPRRPGVGEGKGEMKAKAKEVAGRAIKASTEVTKTLMTRIASNVKSKIRGTVGAAGAGVKSAVEKGRFATDALSKATISSWRGISEEDVLDYTKRLEGDGGYREQVMKELKESTRAKLASSAKYSVVAKTFTEIHDVLEGKTPLTHLKHPRKIKQMIWGLFKDVSIYGLLGNKHMVRLFAISVEKYLYQLIYTRTTTIQELEKEYQSDDKPFFFVKAWWKRVALFTKDIFIRALISFLKHPEFWAAVLTVLSQMKTFFCNKLSLLTYMSSNTGEWVTAVTQEAEGSSAEFAPTTKEVDELTAYATAASTVLPTMTTHMHSSLSNAIPRAFSGTISSAAKIGGGAALGALVPDAAMAVASSIPGVGALTGAAEKAVQITSDQVSQHLNESFSRWLSNTLWSHNISMIINLFDLSSCWKTLTVNQLTTMTYEDVMRGVCSTTLGLCDEHSVLGVSKDVQRAKTSDANTLGIMVVNANLIDERLFVVTNDGRFDDGSNKYSIKIKQHLLSGKTPYSICDVQFFQNDEPWPKDRASDFRIVLEPALLPLGGMPTEKNELKVHAPGVGLSPAQLFFSIREESTMYVFVNPLKEEGPTALSARAPEGGRTEGFGAGGDSSTTDSTTEGNAENRTGTDRREGALPLTGTDRREGALPLTNTEGKSKEKSANGRGQGQGEGTAGAKEEANGRGQGTAGADNGRGQGQGTNGRGDSSKTGTTGEATAEEVYKRESEERTNTTASSDYFSILNYIPRYNYYDYPVTISPFTVTDKHGKLLVYVTSMIQILSGPLLDNGEEVTSYTHGRILVGTVGFRYMRTLMRVRSHIYQQFLGRGGTERFECGLVEEGKDFVGDVDVPVFVLQFTTMSVSSGAAEIQLLVNSSNSFELVSLPHALKARNKESMELLTEAQEQWERVRKMHGIEGKLPAHLYAGACYKRAHGAGLTKYIWFQPHCLTVHSYPSTIWKESNRSRVATATAGHSPGGDGPMESMPNELQNRPCVVQVFFKDGKYQTTVEVRKKDNSVLYKTFDNNEFVNNVVSMKVRNQGKNQEAATMKEKLEQMDPMYGFRPGKKATNERRPGQRSMSINFSDKSVYYSAGTVSIQREGPEGNEGLSIEIGLRGERGYEDSRSETVERDLRLVNSMKGEHFEWHFKNKNGSLHVPLPIGREDIDYLDGQTFIWDVRREDAFYWNIELAKTKAHYALRDLVRGNAQRETANENTGSGENTGKTVRYPSPVLNTLCTADDEETRANKVSMPSYAPERLFVGYLDENWNLQTCTDSNAFNMFTGWHDLISLHMHKTCNVARTLESVSFGQQGGFGLWPFTASEAPAEASAERAEAGAERAERAGSDEIGREVGYKSYTIPLFDTPMDDDKVKKVLSASAHETLRAVNWGATVNKSSGDDEDLASVDDADLVSVVGYSAALKSIGIEGGWIGVGASALHWATLLSNSVTYDYAGTIASKGMKYWKTRSQQKQLALRLQEGSENEDETYERYKNDEKYNHSFERAKDPCRPEERFNKFALCAYISAFLNKYEPDIKIRKPNPDGPTSVCFDLYTFGLAAPNEVCCEVKLELKDSPAVHALRDVGEFTKARLQYKPEKGKNGPIVLANCTRGPIDDGNSYGVARISLENPATNVIEFMMTGRGPLNEQATKIHESKYDTRADYRYYAWSDWNNEHSHKKVYTFGTYPTTISMLDCDESFLKKLDHWHSLHLVSAFKNEQVTLTYMRPYLEELYNGNKVRRGPQGPEVENDDATSNGGGGAATVLFPPSADLAVPPLVTEARTSEGFMDAFGEVITPSCDANKLPLYIRPGKDCKAVMTDHVIFLLNKYTGRELKDLSDDKLKAKLNELKEMTERAAHTTADRGPRLSVYGKVIPEGDSQDDSPSWNHITLRKPQNDENLVGKLVVMVAKQRTEQRTEQRTQEGPAEERSMFKDAIDKVWKASNKLRSFFFEKKGHIAAHPRTAPENPPQGNAENTPDEREARDERERGQGTANPYSWVAEGVPKSLTGPGIIQRRRHSRQEPRHSTQHPPQPHLATSSATSSAHPPANAPSASGAPSPSPPPTPTVAHYPLNARPTSCRYIGDEIFRGTDFWDFYEMAKRGVKGAAIAGEAAGGVATKAWKATEPAREAAGEAAGGVATKAWKATELAGEAAGEAATKAWQATTLAAKEAVENPRTIQDRDGNYVKTGAYDGIFDEFTDEEGQKLLGDVATRAWKATQLAGKAAATFYDGLTGAEKKTLTEVFENVKVILQKEDNDGAPPAGEVATQDDTEEKKRFVASLFGGEAAISGWANALASVFRQPYPEWEENNKVMDHDGTCYDVREVLPNNMYKLWTKLPNNDSREVELHASKLLREPLNRNKEWKEGDLVDVIKPPPPAIQSAKPAVVMSKDENNPEYYKVNFGLGPPPRNFEIETWNDPEKWTSVHRTTIFERNSYCIGPFSEPLVQKAPQGLSGAFGSVQAPTSLGVIIAESAGNPPTNKVAVVDTDLRDGEIPSATNLDGYCLLSVQPIWEIKYVVDINFAGALKGKIAGLQEEKFETLTLPRYERKISAQNKGSYVVCMVPYMMTVKGKSIAGTRMRPYLCKVTKSSSNRALVMKVVSCPCIAYDQYCYKSGETNLSWLKPCLDGTSSERAPHLVRGARAPDRARAQADEQISLELARLGVIKGNIKNSGRITFKPVHNDLPHVGEDFRIDESRFGIEVLDGVFINLAEKLWNYRIEDELNNYIQLTYKYTEEDIQKTTYEAILASHWADLRQGTSGGLRPPTGRLHAVLTKKQIKDMLERTGQAMCTVFTRVDKTNFEGKIIKNWPEGQLPRKLTFTLKQGDGGEKIYIDVANILEISTKRPMEPAEVKNELEKMTPGTKVSVSDTSGKKIQMIFDGIRGTSVVFKRNRRGGEEEVTVDFNEIASAGNMGTSVAPYVGATVMGVVLAGVVAGKSRTWGGFGLPWDSEPYMKTTHAFPTRRKERLCCEYPFLLMFSYDDVRKHWRSMDPILWNSTKVRTNVPFFLAYAKKSRGHKLRLSQIGDVINQVPTVGPDDDDEDDQARDFVSGQTFQQMYSSLNRGQQKGILDCIVSSDVRSRLQPTWIEWLFGEWYTDSYEKPSIVTQNRGIRKLITDRKKQTLSELMFHVEWSAKTFFQFPIGGGKGTPSYLDTVAKRRFDEAIMKNDMIYVTQNIWQANFSDPISSIHEGPYVNAALSKDEAIRGLMTEGSVRVSIEENEQLAEFKKQFDKLWESGNSMWNYFFEQDMESTETQTWFGVPGDCLGYELNKARGEPNRYPAKTWSARSKGNYLLEYFKMDQLYFPELGYSLKTPHCKDWREGRADFVEEWKDYIYNYTDDPANAERRRRKEADAKKFKEKYKSSGTQRFGSLVENTPPPETDERRQPPEEEAAPEEELREAREPEQGQRPETRQPVEGQPEQRAPEQEQGQRGPEPAAGGTAEGNSEGSGEEIEEAKEDDEDVDDDEPTSQTSLKRVFANLKEWQTGHLVTWTRGINLYQSSGILVPVPRIDTIMHQRFDKSFSATVKTFADDDATRVPDFPEDDRHYLCVLKMQGINASWAFAGGLTSMLSYYMSDKTEFDEDHSTRTDFIIACRGRLGGVSASLYKTDFSEIGTKGKTCYIVKGPLLATYAGAQKRRFTWRGMTDIVQVYYLLVDGIKLPILVPSQVSIDRMKREQELEANGAMIASGALMSSKTAQSLISAGTTGVSAGAAVMTGAVGGPIFGAMMGNIFNSSPVHGLLQGLVPLGAADIAGYAVHNWTAKDLPSDTHIVEMNGHKVEQPPDYSMFTRMAQGYERLDIGAYIQSFTLRLSNTLRWMTGGKIKDSGINPHKYCNVGGPVGHYNRLSEWLYQVSCTEEELHNAFLNQDTTYEVLITERDNELHLSSIKGDFKGDHVVIEKNDQHVLDALFYESTCSSLYYINDKNERIIKPTFPSKMGPIKVKGQEINDKGNMFYKKCLFRSVFRSSFLSFVDEEVFLVLNRCVQGRRQECISDSYWRAYETSKIELPKECKCKQCTHNELYVRGRVPIRASYYARDKALPESEMIIYEYTGLQDDAATGFKWANGQFTEMKFEREKWEPASDKPPSPSKSPPAISISKTNYGEGTYSLSLQIEGQGEKKVKAIIPDSLLFLNEEEEQLMVQLFELLKENRDVGWITITREPAVTKCELESEVAMYYSKNSDVKTIAELSADFKTLKRAKEDKRLRRLLFLWAMIVENPQSRMEYGDRTSAGEYSHISRMRLNILRSEHKHIIAEKHKSNELNKGNSQLVAESGGLGFSLGEVFTLGSTLEDNIAIRAEDEVCSKLRTPLLEETQKSRKELENIILDTFKTPMTSGDKTIYNLCDVLCSLTESRNHLSFSELMLQRAKSGQIGSTILDAAFYRILNYVEGTTSASPSHTPLDCYPHFFCNHPPQARKICPNCPHNDANMKELNRFRMRVRLYVLGLIRQDDSTSLMETYLPLAIEPSLDTKVVNDLRTEWGKIST